MSESLTSLKKIKDPLFRGQEHSIKERTKELDDYREQKLLLVDQIKQLGRVFFKLKEGTEMAEKVAGEITTERLKTLEYLAREVSSELMADAEVLRKKSKKLDKRDVFLQDLFEYLSKAMKITEDARLENEQEAVQLGAKLGKVLKDKKQALELNTEAQRKEKKAKDLLKGVEDRFSVIDKIARWFEKEADEEKERLNRQKKEIDLKEKKVKSRETHLETRKKRLERMEKRLLDKEATLKRSAREIKKKEKSLV